MKKTIWIIALILFSGPIVSAQIPVNGNMDTDLSGWTISPVGVDSVIWYDQAAVLLNPDDFPLWSFFPLAADAFAFQEAVPYPVGGPLSYSSLSQVVTLPEQPDKLTFDVTMEVYLAEGEIPETDTFSIFIGDNVQVLMDSDTVLWKEPSDPGVLAWAELSDGDMYYKHVIFTTNYSVDLSGYTGTADPNVMIGFVLSHDIDDSHRTTVTIDNVAISEVEDKDPPQISFGDTLELWPPNHKYRTFNLSDVLGEVVDYTGAPIDVDQNGQILAIYSDEPEDVEGKGDGQTTGDIIILGPSAFTVRAERQGTGNGRVYGVTFEVFDAFGGSTVETVFLAVPHDNSGKEEAVDDGPDAGYMILP